MPTTNIPLGSPVLIHILKRRHIDDFSFESPPCVTVAIVMAVVDVRNRNEYTPSFDPIIGGSQNRLTSFLSIYIKSETEP